MTQIDPEVKVFLRLTEKLYFWGNEQVKSKLLPYVFDSWDNAMQFLEEVYQIGDEKIKQLIEEFKLWRNKQKLERTLTSVNEVVESETKLTTQQNFLAIMS